MAPTASKSGNSQESRQVCNAFDWCYNISLKYWLCLKEERLFYENIIMCCSKKYILFFFFLKSAFIQRAFIFLQLAYQLHGFAFHFMEDGLSEDELVCLARMLTLLS